MDRDELMAKLREQSGRGFESLLNLIEREYPDMPPEAAAHIILMGINLTTHETYKGTSALVGSQRIIDALPDLHRRTIAKMGEIIENIGLLLQLAMLDETAIHPEDGEVKRVDALITELNGLLTECDEARTRALQDSPHARLLKG